MKLCKFSFGSHISEDCSLGRCNSKEYGSMHIVFILVPHFEDCSQGRCYSKTMELGM
jgi:hypothetical protein